MAIVTIVINTLIVRKLPMYQCPKQTQFNATIHFFYHSFIFLKLKPEILFYVR